MIRKKKENVGGDMIRKNFLILAYSFQVVIEDSKFMVDMLHFNVFLSSITGHIEERQGAKCVRQWI